MTGRAASNAARPDGPAAGEPFTRVSAHVVIVDPDRRILLCRIARGIPSAGSWSLPGGGLEFGEPPERGAIREVAEEAGLTVELAGIVGTYNLHLARRSTDGRPLHWVSILYRGRVTGGALRDEADGSTDRCAWFTERDARRSSLVPLAVLGVDLAFAASG